MINAITPNLSCSLPSKISIGNHTSASSQTKMTIKSIITSGIAVILLALSQQVMAHIEYYDLNQGVQIGDLTAAGKAASTAQYGLNPTVSGGGVGAATNTQSDRPLNNTAQWNATNQTYTGVGSFSGVAYNAATGAGTATVTVNDVTDFGWGDGTKTTLGDTHKVDFFNFRLAQAAIVTLTWNVGDANAYYDSGFTLYKGVGSYQGHDDAVDSLNPKAGVPPVKKQNAFDTGFVIDAQGITAPYRKTDTGAPTYTGQFDAFHGWGDGNTAGNWSTLEFNTAVHTLRGTVGADGYSMNAADTLQTLTITLQPDNYTIAASGALGAPGSQSSFGSTNLAGTLTFTAIFTKKSQTINNFVFTPTTLTVGQTTTASATTTSNLAVSFSSNTMGVCTVNGSNVTGITAGTCTIAAKQAGDTNYDAATAVTKDITIGKGDQVITFNAVPKLPIGGTSNISATSTSGLSLSFSSTTASICTVSGSTVTSITAGTCTIAATQAGNANYDAAIAVTQNITIGKGTQTLTFGVAPAITVGSAGTVSATADSGLAASFISSTPSVCTISGNTVIGIMAGTCTIVANQAGNANYNAATVTQIITIGKGTQTLTFGAAPSITVGSAGNVSVTADSGLAASFSSSTTDICTVSGNIVTSITAGICTIVATQAGNANYNAATVTQNITIGKGTQTLTFGAAPAITVGNAGTVSATADSGLAASFSSSTTDVCTVNESNVTGITAGTCTIAATQAGNANYNAATAVTRNFTIGKGSQVINFDPNFGPLPNIVVNNTSDILASATSGLPLNLVSDTPATCSIIGYAVKGIAVGTCTLVANQSGNANYTAATTVTRSLEITSIMSSQTISFGTMPPITVGDSVAVLVAADSTLVVSLSSSTLDTCTVSGYTVTGITTGTCIIAATQAGNANYNAAAAVTQSITIGKGVQALIFGAVPAITVGKTGTVSATASSGLAASFSSSTTGVCTVSGNTVTGITVGTCSIVANQAGNANYNAATAVMQNITIDKVTQELTFGAVPAITVGSVGTVSATASSGLAASFSSSTEDICAVSGSNVTGLTAGTCIIVANQAGNATYNAATAVTQNFIIGAGTQTLTFGTAPAITVGSSGTVSATADSGLAASFSSSTAGVCTVNGSNVTGITADNCIITATQAGNTNYNAATAVTQNINIGKGTQVLTFGAAPAITMGSSGTVSATADSGLAASFSSGTADVCTVNGNVVTGITAGICIIAANQAGNINYNAATAVTQTIAIGKSSQSIAFVTFPNSLITGVTGMISASSTSNLPVSNFSSITPNICTVNGSTVTGITYGACIIAANQEGNGNYLAASQITKSVTIVATQSISFGTAPDIALNDAGIIFTASSSGLPVSLVSTTLGICTVSDNIVTTIGSGNCIIAANQTGNNNYIAAPQVTQTFLIKKYAQVLIFGAAPSIATGKTGIVSIPNGAKLSAFFTWRNPVFFTSTTPGICTVSANIVTGKAAGICTIAANQAGNIHYSAAVQVTQSFTIRP